MHLLEGEFVVTHVLSLERGGILLIGGGQGSVWAAMLAEGYEAVGGVFFIFLIVEGGSAHELCELMGIGLEGEL